MRSRLLGRAAIVAAVALLPVLGLPTAHAALLTPLTSIQPTPTIGAFGAFGWKVALSTDGKTALVGSQGAGAWIFHRVGASWVQDGPPLGGAAAPREGLGCSVALSADGSTALVGAPGQEGVSGAAWVFTDGPSGWQGTKLTPGEAMPPGNALSCEASFGGDFYAGKFGSAVALSADGATALVGSPRDGVATRREELLRGGHVGSACVFVRSGDGWVQQGPRLTANGEHGEGEFGSAVTLSADGSTALIGAPDDAGGERLGSAWAFVRSGQTWSQQARIKPRVYELGGNFGTSVALSGAGNAALIGGPEGEHGAAWSFARSASRWAQVGPQLTAGEQYSGPSFGRGVALSSDGDTAFVSGVKSNGDMTNSPAPAPGRRGHLSALATRGSARDRSSAARLYSVGVWRSQEMRAQR